jgi:hypothetical protein
MEKSIGIRMGGFDMKSTKQQLLRQLDIQPTEEVIEDALKEANVVYLRFLKELENHDIQLEWRYYTDGKAWLGKGLHRWTGPRGGNKEVTAFWLSIWDGFFKVTIYIPEKFRGEVNRLPVKDGVKQMVTDSRQMGNTLKYFPLVFDLDSDGMLEEVFTLIEFRKSIK